MQLVILTVSIGLVSVGWTIGNKSIAITGATLYLVYLLINTIQLIRIAVLHRKGMSTVESMGNEKSRTRKAESIFNGLLSFAGMIAFGWGASGDFKDIWAIPGAIIFLGAIFFYLVDGIIAQEVAGIPLRMGYGGWYIPRPRKRSSSRHYKRRRY